MIEIIKKDEHHILFAIKDDPPVDSGPPNFIFKAFLVQRDGDPEEVYLGQIADGSNTRAFSLYLEKLDIAIENSNWKEVVEIFEAMHPWTNVLKSVNDFDPPKRRIPEINKDKVKAYKEAFQSLVFKVEKRGSILTFWAVHQLSGDLEQWEISEDNQRKKHVENKVLEQGLFY